MIRYADTNEVIPTGDFDEMDVAEAFAHIYDRVVEIVEEEANGQTNDR